jgi:hypothetical protein
MVKKKGRKLIFITACLLLFSIGAGVVQAQIQSSDPTSFTENTNGEHITEGYRVDNPSLVGSFSEYTINLATKELGIEVMSERTPTARHFKNNDDSFTAFISLAPNCYQDENGIWHDVNPNQPCTVTWERYEEISNYYGKVCYYNDHFSIPIADPSDTRYSCWVYKPTAENAKYKCPVGQDGHTDFNPLAWDDMESYWRAFAQWDTSSVPDASIIWPWIELYLYVDEDDYDPFRSNKYADIYFYHLSNKPSDYYKTSGSSPDIVSYDEGSSNWNKIKNLMEDCTDGNRYSGDSGSHFEVGDGLIDDLTLSFDSEDDIKDQLQDDWFAVALKDKHEDFGSSDRSGGVQFRGPLPGEAEMVLSFQYAPPQNVAVVVAGGYGPGYDEAYQSIVRTAKRAREVFEDDIGTYHVKYLELKDKSVVRDTIENDIAPLLGGEKKVMLFFVDHGGRDGSFALNPSELMYPNELNSWVSTMESKCNPSSVVIVLEACFGGTYIDEMSKDGRVVITATDSDSSSWYYVGGEAFFSKPFFTALGEGKSYGEAWETADKVVDERAKPKNCARLFSVRSIISSVVIKDINDDAGIILPLPPKDRPPQQNPKIEDTGNGFAVGSRKADTLPMRDIKGEYDGNVANGLYP